MASQLCANVLTHCTLFSIPRSRLICQKSKRNAHVMAPMLCISATASATSERRSANYPPNLWDYDYIQSLQSDSMQEVHRERAENLKQKTKRLIYDTKEVVHQLELIDALGQLGLGYHFEEESNEVLGIVHSSMMKKMDIISPDDLYATALLFRLLRVHGFDVPQDILNKFKDTSDCHDIRSLLSLYEASYLGMEGERTLEEARDFTTRHLKDCIQGDQQEILQPGLRKRVAYALEVPLHWRMQRLHARWFIDAYAKQDDMNPTLLEFAKLDFNMIQGIHKKELRELSRWWTDLGLHRGKTSFIRDRLVESHIWFAACVSEPKFWRSREVMAKSNCLIAAIDDVYDAYGTLDEVELFTDAVIRWDVNAIDHLPEYMKIIFLALFNTTNKIAYEVLKDTGVDVIASLKRLWADLCKAYLVESRWYHNGYTPTLTEYLDNAWVSSSGTVLLNSSYYASEDKDRDALEEFKFYPDAVQHSSMLFRLYNDLATSSAELARGDVQKSIQCYMHHKNVSEAIGRMHIGNLIIETWKKLNGSCFPTSTLGESFNNIALSIPRLCQYIYGDGDKFGVPDEESKSRVISLLIEPIPL